MIKNTKKSQKNLRSFSTPNFPNNKKNLSLLQPHINLQSNQQQLIHHRKQIQSTLNELHRLQSQIYQLNIPQNPHSSSPVKKQIKQLSYLYQNMTKPKRKNNLNIRLNDIELAMRIMNNDWHPDLKLSSEPMESQFTKRATHSEQHYKSKTNILGKTLKKINSPVKCQNNNNANNNILADKSYKIPKKVFQQKLQALSHCQVNTNFMSKNEKNESISTNQLYQFINYTQCQDFDPVRQAYEKFINQNGQFDLSIYNSFSYLLGLPKIKNISNFVGAVKHSYSNNMKHGQLMNDKIDEGELLNMKITSKDTAQISYEQFKRVIQYQI